MRRPLVLIVLGLTLALAIALASGCGSGGSSKQSGNPQTSASPAASATLTQQDWGSVSGDPASYKGSPVDIMGQVFNIDTSSEGTAIQIFADPQNSQQNTVIYTDTLPTGLKDQDYVHVIGILSGTYEGENSFGSKLSVPLVEADSVTIVDATAMAPPAERTAKLEKSVNQHGVIVDVSKVEFAAGETRVHVTVINKSGSKASFYGYSANAVQGGRQFSAESVSGLSDYPQVDSDIVAGARSSGIVVLPAMNPDKLTKLIFEGYSDNYNITLHPFVFIVPKP